MLIPIRSAANDIVAFAGRHRPSERSNGFAVGDVAKYLLTPGFRKAEVLFNATQAREAMRATADESGPSLYVVEGFLDALRLQALNLSAVAVMGTNLSEKQREALVSLISGFSAAEGTHLNLRLFFDRDAAGFDGANRTSRQLLGMPGVATEWVGFAENDISGKDPDEILRSLGRDEARAMLDQHSLPAFGVLVAAGLGYKDATPVLNPDRWNEISRYPRERALVQAARAVRSLSGAAVNWSERLEELTGPRPQWVVDLLWILGSRQQGGRAERSTTAFELTFLVEQEARLNHARTLAEHGARRGELPCDDEAWRALDRNAQLFNTLALDRLKQPTWQQAAPCDAVHLPRKLSGEEKVLNDPRRKVMPHASDLHLQQFLMNELLTERHDFSNEGPQSFSDCIPAVRWFGIEGETRVTGYVEPGEPSPALFANERGDHDEEVLSYAYQIDMDVLEGRRKPSDQGMFRPYIECWRGYMASLDRQARAIGPHVHVLRLDAKRYYDAIQRFVVRDRLLAPIEQALTITGAEHISSILGLPTNDVSDATTRLVDLLCGGLFEHRYQHPDNGSERPSADVLGIPQGPVISAWIGTIAMFPVDASARAFMKQPDQRRSDDSSRPRVGYARYVDDIVLLADSESGLNALREVVQAAAARLELTLVRKGASVTPGSPDFVMRQLNSGRALAPSVPVWEPPMVGDGETGWGMAGDDVGMMDRQSALHLLRHPSLLDDVATVHEKVREAMRAPDLRPSDLGKCARALWWQVAMQSLDIRALADTDAWEVLWRGYEERWNEVCVGHAWAPAFHRRDYDTLFAVEGLDMLMDSSQSVEKGRTQEWINRHRKSLDALARAILRTDALLQYVTLSYNRAHIQRRARMVQWKALQSHPGLSASLYPESQQSYQRTLTDWLCQAAILLHRYGMNGEAASHPLETLLKLPDSLHTRGPDDIRAAVRYLKTNAAGDELGHVAPDAQALKVALPFLVANATEKCRWQVLGMYPDTLTKGLLEAAPLRVLPPLPVDGAGMLAYTKVAGTSSIRLVAFQRTSDATPPDSAPGAALSCGQAEFIAPVQLHWLASEELAAGLHRRQGGQPVGLEFNSLQPANRARFAADLYEVLHAIQRQEAGDGKEWVTVMAHLAHEPVVGSVAEVGECKWYLVSTPVPGSHLGVSTWVRDGRGGLRSVSVPGGEYTKLWRLGCAVSDALQMAVDLPNEPVVADESEDALTHPTQIEDYVLRQQLVKLRGAWLADAQMQDEAGDGLPKTVRRALEILRRFDPELDAAKQVRLVLHTETETRSMAMRLQRKGPSDLRDRLHLLPAVVLQRLPLSVLECLPLRRDECGTSLRTDLALLLALTDALDGDDLEGRIEALQDNVTLGSVEAFHIGVVLAATGVALRGLVASAWGMARYRDPIAWRDRLPIPAGWNLPEANRQDPQQEYDTMRTGLRNDDWAGLKAATPWHWMLALLGILDCVAPQALDATGDNALRAIYEHLRQWHSAPSEPVERRKWTWPYDDMPAYDAEIWRALARILPSATLQVDEFLGVAIKQIEAPVFRRHRDDNGFTDAESQQWTLVKLQYTGLGTSDSVGRVQRGSRRLATWTEARRLVDGELLSVHALDDKLGRWWEAQREAAPGEIPVAASTDVSTETSAEALPEASTQEQPESPAGTWIGTLSEVSDGTPEGTPTEALTETPTGISTEPLTESSAEVSTGMPTETPTEAPIETSAPLVRTANGNEHQQRVAATRRVIGNVDETRGHFRESRLASWRDRSALKCPSHMRVALLQWRISESYSHPLAEVGLHGMGMPERAHTEMSKMLDDSSVMTRVREAAVRGSEFKWDGADSEAIASWPEHRRRSVIKRALDACHQLKVDLLVLPEVSVRRETVDWLDGELQRQYPGLAVLAGTYRHFGESVDRRGDAGAAGDAIHHLMAPLTLLWSPDAELSKSLFGDIRPPKTLRFWRGKKYRAVAANELFYPNWNPSQPLFRIEPLLDQLGDLVMPAEQLRAVLRAVSGQMPPLRYCMELICSELFLLTSPANVGPLQQEVAAMLKRFPSAHAGQAQELIDEDVKQLGMALSVLQEHQVPRRTVLLVPAATKRSNDYWHAGQASVLASGTATVFCNAAESAISCGGSCFIGIDSATKPHSESPGLIETLTPYHGWRRGILTARADGALSDADQALVVVDIDPVHVVTGKPRPQLLPEPMALVAYLPVVELLDAQANSVALQRSLSGGAPAHLKATSNADEVRAALATVATSPRRPGTVEPSKLWGALHDLLGADRADGPELDEFAKLFCDPRAVHARLQTWVRDRHQQPHPAYGPLNREPAWLDFLDVDLTLKDGQDLPTIAVPPWHSNST